MTADLNKHMYKVTHSLTIHLYPLLLTWLLMTMIMKAKVELMHGLSNMDFRSQKPIWQ